MNSKGLLKCPVCGSARVVNMLELNCGNFDSSMLYQTVKINACGQCGHVYNRLSPGEIVGLMKYYDEEYAPTNICTTKKISDRSNNSRDSDSKQYCNLYGLISPFLETTTKILDVGCGVGGFLEFLDARGLRNLSGIDVAEEYVEYAKKGGKFDVKLGSAEAIPFGNSSFDVLVLEQVMEHLVQPIQSFKEARRVLVEGGLFCIGVPDAARYDDIYFFDFYWFIMREHIQHFDLDHLKLLAEREGFELVSYHTSETRIVSERMVMPNLNVIFRLTGVKGTMKISEECSGLRKEIDKYLRNELERLNHKKTVIDRLVESQRPVYAWGIGREFLYLYEAAGLKHCNIVGLIDSNEYKQTHFFLDGKRIVGRDILKESAPGAILIITAIAHMDVIRTELAILGYHGEILDFLQN